MKIERYAYFPMWSSQTKSYYFDKLKVIKVWIYPVTRTIFDPNLKAYSIFYVLENCYRVMDVHLITNIDNVCPDQKFIEYRRLKGIKKHLSIFTPADEKYYRERHELDLMKSESDSIIKECIANDEIFGETNVLEFITGYQDIIH